MGPSFEDLTSTFVFSAARSDTAVLAEVPKGLRIDPARQRQGHRKSKTGCENCKRRRVKCNEEMPCASCRRRSEWCERPEKKGGGGGGQGRTPGSSMAKPMPTMVPRPSSSARSSDPSDAVVNLLHLRLFHHFQTHTCQTLVFGADAWAAALQMSFQFEFLASAVLCVAARHLAALESPSETSPSSSYSSAAAAHLCRALAGFRHELLTNDFTATHLDAFIATSTLLQFELWTSTDLFAPTSGGAGFDMERDRLFTFSASLKQVFLKSVPAALRRQPSVFMPYIQHDAATTLTRRARISSDTVAAYRTFFARCPQDDNGADAIRRRFDDPLPPFTRSDDSSGAPLWQPSAAPAGPTGDGSYVPVIDGLCLLLSFLPDAHPAPSSTMTEPPPPLFSDLLRCVFSFPILCRGPFVARLHSNDPHAFFVLYHFYRAVRILLPEDKCWWAQRRAAVMEKALRDWSTGQLEAT